MGNPLYNQFEEILQDYLADFNQKRNYPFVVQPSIPVVWFGNLEQYHSSERKIVTVALNPSFYEFPVDDAPRFDVNASTPQALYATLNSYFCSNPYRKWFNHFEFVLNRFNATYYERNDQYSRRAIHIDIYSAIATRPTWGALTEQQREQLSNIDLFGRLLELLDPNLILFSGNIGVFNDVFTNAALQSETRFLGNAYIREYSYGGRMLVTGLNYRGQPFCGMSHDDMSPVLEQINERF